MNLLGITPADFSRFDPEQIWQTFTGPEAITFKKCWARSAKWGKIWGSGESRTTGFFCAVNRMTFRQVPNVQFSPNLATTRESLSPRRFFKRILDNFSLGVGLLPPKISKLKRANRCLTQTSLYSPRDALQRQAACCSQSLRVVAEGPRTAGSFTGQSTYGFGRESSRISAFLPTFYMQNASKVHFLCASYSPEITLQNAFGYSMLQWKVHKVPFASGAFL